MQSRADHGRPVAHPIGPGKRTLTESLVGEAPATRALPVQRASVELRGERPTLASLFGRPAVQQRPAAGGGVAPTPGTARNEDQIHHAAAAGTQSAGGPLPHLAAIQRSFGRHDVSHVVAHTDAAASAGARAMGAEAFATGHHVAFDGAPSVHTAAHEAAHVVQQAGGVQLRGGVGAVGDVYERNADAAADAVVRGESAEALLAPFAGTGGAAGRSVQRRVVGGGKYGAAFTNTEDPTFQIFDSQIAAEEHARAHAEEWRENPENEATALERLTAHAKAVPSNFRGPGDIDGMTLDGFDRHASTQVDWITAAGDMGAPLFDADQKRRYRNLLALARKDDGLILNACGQYTVADLLALRLGSSLLHDPRFRQYAMGVAGTGLTRIVSLADTPAAADRWGKALIDLATSPKLTRDVVSQVIPQRPGPLGSAALQLLVETNYVTEFIDYVNGRNVILHATNGAEVLNLCRFLHEGGDPAGYGALEPELRHVHRYTMQCLDALLVHRASGRRTRPLTVIMQTALDHNGVTYRNDHVTNLVLRPNRTTIIVESQASLGDFAGAAERIAARHKVDGKVDEILITGHGEFSSMGLAATKRDGEYDDTHQDIELKSTGARLVQALREVDGARQAFRNVLQTCPGVVDKSPLPDDLRAAAQRLVSAMTQDPTALPKLETALAGLEGLAPNTLTPQTESFIDRLMAIMKDDPTTSRIVLHACLTGSNKVLVDIDGTAPVATQQAAIKSAIAKDPSLVTKVKERIPRKHDLDFLELWGKKGVSVLGANASVYGRTTELQEPGTDRITLSNPGDDRLTASKREYARHGIEPEGALRAAVEAWAEDKNATINALRGRIATPIDTGWSDTLIRALYARIVANPNNGALLVTLERASGPLSHLVSSEKASVDAVRGKLPGAHMGAVFTALTGADPWAQPAYWFTKAVLYQVWMNHDNSKRADFLAALTAAAAAGNTDTQRLEKYLDFALVTPHLGALLTVPDDVGGLLRGPTLLALSFAAKQGSGAPAAALDYLRGVLDLREQGGRQFPVEAHVDTLLRGKSTSAILRAVGRAGVVAPVEGRITPHNLSVARGGRNDTTVESVTLQGRTNAEAAIYNRPDGDELAQLGDATEVFIHGKIADQWYVIEHGQTTAFVRQDRITVA